MFNPTIAQRANLARLADYLAALPTDYANFCMAVYMAPRTSYGLGWNIEPKNRPDQLNECGTAACAIGHGPYAGIPLEPNELFWYQYAFRAFGTDESGSREGKHMFGPDNINCPHAAAARIREVLDGSWDEEYDFD